jgi:thiol-disulfide isomerase/thioredoxin
VALLVLSGCSTILTGGWVMPSWQRGEAQPQDDAPVVYVSSSITFAPYAEIEPSACRNGPQSEACESWRKTKDLALAEVLSAHLSIQNQSFHFEPVNIYDHTWRERAMKDDLHVHITYDDVLQKDASYGGLLMWRSDTYTTNAVVRVSAAWSDRELTTFSVSDNESLGLNYMWFIPIVVPLFPVYIDDNEQGRADLTARMMRRIGEELLPGLVTAYRVISEGVGEQGAKARKKRASSRAKAKAVEGGGDLDIQRWLDLPRTRLLVVDFYADWCKPCKASVPRWRALHRKWRKRGLRVVVVHTQSRGTHATPGWSPDDVVADPYGVIAKSWKVDDRLPQAFLWSWDGQRLASGASVDEIAGVVKDWFADAPRIAVARPESGSGKALKGRQGRRLTRAVRGELTRHGKLEVLASKRERKLLARVRKESHRADRDDATRCQMGREVSPNMVLKIVVEKAHPGNDTTLRLELFGVEKACMVAWASVPLIRRQEDAAAAEVVAKLLSELKASAELPSR